MYRLQYSETQIAQALGVTLNSLHRFMNKRANRELRERCCQERMLANIAGADGGELEFVVKNKSEKEFNDTIIYAISEGLIEMDEFTQKQQPSPLLPAPQSIDTNPRQ